MNAQPTDGTTQAFRTWVDQVLKPRAMSRMINATRFDAAMAQVEFLPDVIERQEKQKEFVIPIWEYLDIVVSEERIRNGRQALRRHRDLFITLEKRFGVEPEIIAAIWGIESGYGVNRGSFNVLSALATLAWCGRRATFFEDELISALRLLQARHVTPDRMVGSWAGAMGHGQFLPSSLLNFAVDVDGDGRADIWGDKPDDALASIANYLEKHQWRQGQPWGYEVILPEGFDHSLTSLDYALSAADWHDLGVRVSAGGRLPDYGSGSILLPGGAQGAALMVLRNFNVLLRYNRSEAYAIGVGHLADRIGGGRAFSASWPLDDTLLSRDEVSELQVRLTENGYDTQGVDGLRGPNTNRAVRQFQADAGLIADGFITDALLTRLREMKGKP